MYGKKKSNLFSSFQPEMFQYEKCKRFPYVGFNALEL